MKMAYRNRWKPEITEARRVLAGFAMTEERKWGKPTYTVDGKNIVILQGFKEFFAIGFFSDTDMMCVLSARSVYEPLTHVSRFSRSHTRCN